VNSPDSAGIVTDLGRPLRAVTPSTLVRETFVSVSARLLPRWRVPNLVAQAEELGKHRIAPTAVWPPPTAADMLSVSFRQFVHETSMRPGDSAPMPRELSSWQ
jgi:hypothetical protein